MAGFDPVVEVSGKPVARAFDKLNAICKRLGVTRLSTFYSESMDETFANIGEPVPAGMTGRPIIWTEPAIGLRTIAALLDYLKVHPDEVPNAASVARDLEGFQKVFEKAKEHATRFRLRIDI